MSDFKIENVSIAGAPTIEWHFTGDVARAECAGGKAYAEMRGDGCADLRITDAKGEVLADVVVRKMPADETITASLMNVGTALLWSHARYVEAKAAEETAP
jgi:lambda repressor-like predicted transcriptional regulator